MPKAANPAPPPPPAEKSAEDIEYADERENSLKKLRGANRLKINLKV